MIRLLPIILILLIACNSKDNKQTETKKEEKKDSILDVVVEYGPQIIKEPMTQVLVESSGLLYYNGLVWSFNDSDNKPELYGLRPESWEIERTIVLTNTVNYDWEDITHDEEYIYVGDFGNNTGSRTNLRLLKISKEALKGEIIDHVVPQEIKIRFSDQLDYTAGWMETEFDCESVINFKDELYVFAKDWVNEKTRVYKVPKDPGEHIIDPIMEFDSYGLVTGADCINDELIAICGYRNYVPFIYLFKDFKEGDFFSGSKIRLNLTPIAQSQTEGIAFINDSTIFLSNENSVYPQRLLKVSLNELGIYPF